MGGTDTQADNPSPCHEQLFLSGFCLDSRANTSGGGLVLCENPSYEMLSRHMMLLTNYTTAVFH